MENNKIEKRIARIEKDILRYKEYLLKDLASNDLSKIESALRGYSQDILSLCRIVEELKELI